MTRAHPATTPVARSKTAALARVLDSVPKGYVYYTAGTCPAEKVLKLARKFHEHYGIGCSPAQRITRKKQGLANAMLVLYWPEERGALGASAPSSAAVPAVAPEQTACAAPERSSSPSPDAVQPDALAGISSGVQVSWLLLVSEGAGAVHEEEQLRSVLNRPRLRWLGYELVRRSVRGGTSWTWRRTKQEMADLHALLAEQLNRRQKEAVAQTLLRISRQPGFAGVREQSWALCQWARSRGYAGELPFLYFMQKVGHGEPLRLN